MWTEEKRKLSDLIAREKGFTYSPFWERVAQFFHPGRRRCDVCGEWVENVEVPIHIRGASWFVHPIHIILSKKGREIIRKMAGRKEFGSR